MIAPKLSLQSSKHHGMNLGKIDDEEVYKQISIMKERSIRFLFNALQKSSYATTSNQF